MEYQDTAIQAAPPKNIRYFLDLWRFRKWYFLIPAVLIIAGAATLAKKLPAVYQSSSTILIEEQQIPPDIVRSLITGFADQRIQSLTQQILSRTKLLEIIQEFNLYADLREKYSKEEILELMRKNIKLDTISAEVGGKSRSKEGMTIAFKISYQGENPGVLQKVVGKLASLYLEQNLKHREAQAQTTTKFLEAELVGLKERIQTLGQKITTYKETHEGLLPELQQFNLNQAERIEAELKSLDNSIKAYENQKTYLDGMLEVVKAGGVAEGKAGEAGLSPRARLQALDIALADLRAKFAEDHPDIQKILREKTQLEKITGKSAGAGGLRQKKLADLEAELALKQGKYSEEHPEIRKLKNEIAQIKGSPDKKAGPLGDQDAFSSSEVNLRSQLQVITNDIAAAKANRQNLQEKLKEYKRRLEAAPKVEQEYLALQRDYQNAHTKHQEVMNKLMEARISEGMEEHQKGGKFTIIDAANYPDMPIKPNRQLILIMGLIFGLGSGVAAMVWAENADHSIKRPEELAGLTERPPLGVIPRIVTPFDLKAQKRRRQIWLLAMVGSLAAGLLLVHFFYMDLYLVANRIMKLVDKYS